MLQQPRTAYARSGDVSIAYKVFGDGPLDVVLIPGYLSHVELVWDIPPVVHMFDRLAKFARVMIFDKRGTGMSDPVSGVPTLEDRIEDVRAVMDAVGSTRAALLGISEGAPLAIMLAATHPDLVSHLVLYGGMARSTWAEDYPWATPRDDLLESSREMAPYLFDGAMIDVMAPSLADIEYARDIFAKLQRYSATPAMLQQMFEMFLDIDVRALLPSVAVPTLVLHRVGDRAVNRHASEYMAERIPGAKYVELEGIDHAAYAGDTDALIDEVEEFLTGVRQGAEVDRIVTTVMFVDIVGSTQRAAEMGDRKWTELLETTTDVLRGELRRFRGVEVKTLGDGLMATFDGPARSIRCALAMVTATAPLGVEVRVGLHTGEVEVTDGDDVAGLAVHIAARVGALADTGEVLVSRTVKDLVAGSQLGFVDRGEHSLKGVPDTWQLFGVARGDR